MRTSSHGSKVKPATAALLSLLAAAPTVWAVDAGPVAIHGTISATSSYSDEYNYLGETKDRFDLNVVELTVNGAHRFENGLRVAAQIYAYEMAGYSDVALDFANLDYSFNESFGIRLGRNKTSFGLYGDSQDVDILRPFAFLPLDVYAKTFRPLNAALDGIGFYGTIAAGAAGSFDYQLNAGWLPPVDVASPYMQGSSEAGLSTIYRLKADKPVYNVSLFWNTPVDGLRAGYSYTIPKDIKTFGTMKTHAQIAQIPSDARLLAAAFPAAYWDAAIAGQQNTGEIDAPRHTLSVEYTRGNWQYAAEYFYSEYNGVNNSPAPIGSAPTAIKFDSYYGSVTWQVAPKVQLGAYYAESVGDKKDRDGDKILSVAKHTAYLKDLAVAASYSLTDWWLLKLEVHDLNGTRGVTARANGDAAKWKKNWNYVVLKTTISF